MPSSPKLKKRAAEFEQKKQFDKALELYIQILQDSGRDLGDDDVPLYNRVGDLLMRQGRVSEALSYYESAVDVYAERGYLNNAIALCSKILRQSPGRTAVYYKLGRISASKGFKSDARKNFLEYAERMQKSGHLDEAFRALKEFAALYPDQDDVRLILAEQLSKENRKGEALEQLQELHSKLEREGREAEARATIDRMKAIDPEVVPRKTAPRGVERQNDLIFLDLSDAEAPPRQAPAPTPSRPARRITVSQPQIPALEGLKVTFVPDEESETTLSEPVARIEGFEATSTETEPAEEATTAAPAPGESAEVTPPRDHDVARAEMGFDSDMHPVSGEEQDVEIEPVSGLELVDDEASTADETIVAGDNSTRLAGFTPRDDSASGDVVTGNDPESVAGDSGHDAAQDAVETPRGIFAVAAERAGTGADDVRPDDHVLESGAVTFQDADAGNPADATPTMIGAPSHDDEDARAAREESEAALTDTGLSPRDFDEDTRDAFLPARSDVDAPEAAGVAPEDESGPDSAGESTVHDESGETSTDVVAAERHDEDGPPSAQMVRDTPGHDGAADAIVEEATSASSDHATGDHQVVEEQAGGGARPESEDADAERNTEDTREPPEGVSDELAAIRDEAGLKNEWPEQASPVELLKSGAPGRSGDFTSVDEDGDALAEEFGSPASNEDADDDFSELLNSPPSFGEGSHESASIFTPIPGFSVEDDNARDQAERSPTVLGKPESGTEPEAAPGDAAQEAAVDSGSGGSDAEDTRSGDGERVQFRTPRPTVSLGGAEDHLRRRLELDPENWGLRRQLGEALLDSGNREDGLYELELAMVGFEFAGELDRAQEVTDEIIRVMPTSVRHHQKRVEYAVRAKDRHRLVDAYLELADALFRTGEADKSVSVYARVLELSPQSERAVFALATLAPDVLSRMRGSPARSERWSDELEAVADNGPLMHTDEASGDDRDIESSEDPSRAAGVSLEDDSSPASVDTTSARDSEQASGAEPELADATANDRGDAGAHSHLQASEVSREDLATPEPPLDAVAEAAPAPREGTVTRRSTDHRATTRNGERRPRPDTPILNRARGLTPASGNGSTRADFVDLGAWLRNAEPERSTRMTTAETTPSGDEQADFDDMLRRFKRGIQENVDEEDFDAHYDLGVAYKEMGLTDEAIAEFQKALRGSDQRVRAYEALGQCFVEKEQFHIAAALLQRAVEMPSIGDQRLVGVLYLLGYANEQTGRHVDALGYYQRVFAVDIQFRDIGTRISAMEQFTK